MDRAVLVPPVNEPLPGLAPEATGGGGRVEPGPEPVSLPPVTPVDGVPEDFLHVGPQPEGLVELRVHEGVLMRRPDDVDPVAPLPGLMRRGLHLHQPVPVGVPTQEELERPFGTRLVPAHPVPIAGDLELLRHVDDIARLRVHQLPPLTFVIALRRGAGAASPAL